MQQVARRNCHGPPSHSDRGKLMDKAHTTATGFEKSAGITPVKKSRISNQVVVQLTRMILSGEFEAGAKLPTERDLAPMLSVTRTTLREALRRMETMGLICVRQGDGIYVQDHTINLTIEFVKFLVESGLGLDREFILSLEETRRIFATKIIELAAERVNQDSLDRLDKLVAECPEAGSPELLSGDWDFRFYREIAIASGNRVLLYMFNSFKDFFGITRWLYSQLDEKQEESLAELNARLVRALRNGDKKKAVKLVEQRMKQDEAALKIMLDSTDMGRFQILQEKF